MIFVSLLLILVGAFFEAWATALTTHWYMGDRQRLYIMTAIGLFFLAALMIGGGFVLAT